jgi:hypothetical protein
MRRDMRSWIIYKDVVTPSTILKTDTMSSANNDGNEDAANSKLSAVPHPAESPPIERRI